MIFYLSRHCLVGKSQVHLPSIAITIVDLPPLSNTVQTVTSLLYQSHCSSTSSLQFFCCCYSDCPRLLVATMPAKKRVSSDAVTPNKRLKVASRNTASQPIEHDTQLSLPCISPRKALLKASQALDFESQLCELQAEDAIFAPAKGSEEATIATNEAANESFDAHLEYNFAGIDWACLPRYTKPLASQRSKRSWVYRHGYHIARQQRMP
jgi:hypothetical protein